MVNIIVELSDGEIISLRGVSIAEALRRLVISYGEEIFAMVVEPSHREPRFNRRHDLWGNRL